MNECKDVLAQLSDYLDHELPGETSVKVAEHLTGCHSCEEAADGLLRSIEACREFAAGERPGQMPEQVKEELMAAYLKVQEAIRKRDASQGNG